MGQGWQACEDELRLMGWSRKRRVVVMRRQRPMDCPDDRAQVKRGRPRKENPPEQAELHFIDENQPVKSWEYAVLVCNTDYEVEHIGQLYRDRADCRICKVSGFDEIKGPLGPSLDTNSPVDGSCLARGQASGLARPARLERLHHARHRTLRPERARGGADLQRVDLIRSAGSSQDPAGGDYEPAQAAGCGGPHDATFASHQASRGAALVPAPTG